MKTGVDGYSQLSICALSALHMRDLRRRACLMYTIAMIQLNTATSSHLQVASPESSAGQVRPLGLQQGQ